MVRLAFLLLLLIHTGWGESDSFQIVRSVLDESIFFKESGCEEGGGKFAIVVHGWVGSCSEDTAWVPDVLTNLTVHRGGCLICMDFSKYSKQDYFRVLVPQLSNIANVLVEKLRDLEQRGFDPVEGFIFGHSFGSHIATEAGRRFGFRRLGRIDACEPAGPGFDAPNLAYSQLDPRLAARNVQCIFTSQVGVKRRACHQNWNMGDCGLGQPEANIIVSHILCPKFYNSAFRNEFRAVRKPDKCASFRTVEEWPVNLRMGYFTNVISGVSGDLFALTTKDYPYNVVEE